MGLFQVCLTEAFDETHPVEYLLVVLDEIVVAGNGVVIRGRYRNLPGLTVR